MKRITYKDASGNWVISCNKFWNYIKLKLPAHLKGEAVDRLAEIENILGDDYDIEELMELVRNNRFRNCAPKEGDRVFYFDECNNEKEYGTVGSVFYENGILYSFSVNFDNSDFDEFYGSAWGTCIFPDDKCKRGRNNE